MQQRNASRRRRVLKIPRVVFNCRIETPDPIPENLAAAGVPELVEIVRAEIAGSGPLPFRRFMELALYEPRHGYYASGRAAIGRRGDYFTSVSVGPLFGKLLAVQFAEMWERLGKPHEFSIVEQGAHSGEFAADVLEAVRLDAPDFFEAVRCRIVEPFAILRARQERRLAQFAGKISWHPSLEALPPFTGVHFSNELLDALPVHRIVFRNGSWREQCVGLQDGGFVFVDGDLSCEALRARVESLALPRIGGYATEVNLDALRWMETLAAKLERGFVLAIDYGHTRDWYYDPGRVSGTLACFAKHRRHGDPLHGAGEADITAHVEFTSLIEHAGSLGLQLGGFTDQHHFIVCLGARVFPDTEEDSPARRQAMRAFKTLMHPGLLGQSFKVLSLGKNVAPAGNLTGFQFGTRW